MLFFFIFLSCCTSAREWMISANLMIVVLRDRKLRKRVKTCLRVEWNRTNKKRLDTTQAEINHVKLEYPLVINSLCIVDGVSLRRPVPTCLQYDRTKQVEHPLCNDFNSSSCNFYRRARKLTRTLKILFTSSVLYLMTFNVWNDTWDTGTPST